MLSDKTLSMVLALCTTGLALAQGPSSETLAELEWGDARAQALTKSLRERAGALDRAGAAKLREQLEAAPRDLVVRMVLIFHEEPEPRRARGERPDPVPHGRLVLGLIEQHPRSRFAGTAGLLLYPYKRDGMYTGPAWDGAIALWERLVAEHPKDPAIACNAGSFLMADPFRMVQDGARARELLERARELDPSEPRWALKLGAYHALMQQMTREPEARAAHAAAGVPHLRAAWDLTQAGERAALDVMGEPLSMVLASAYFDAGEAESARTFAARALQDAGTEAPPGDLVYEMNTVLGRLALAAGDADGAARYLLAAGESTGSPVLGSFGPDMALARALLAAGKRDAVLAFLVRCKGFWHSGADELASWIRSIEDGHDPWDHAPRRP